MMKRCPISIKIHNSFAYVASNCQLLLLILIKNGMVGTFLSCHLTIYFSVSIVELLFLKFLQQLASHVHQNQSVHDDVDMLLPTRAF